MDIKSFSSEYSFKINIIDYSIEYDDVMSSLFNHRQMIHDDSINNNYNTTEDKSSLNNKENIGMDIFLNNIHLDIHDLVFMEDVFSSILRNIPDSREYKENRNNDKDVSNDSVDVKDVLYSVMKNMHEYLENKNDTSNLSNDLDYIEKQIMDALHEDIQENITVEKTEFINKIDINQANEEELRKVPGIKLIHAKKILQLRGYNTYINSYSDLQEKLGINDEELNQIRKYVTIDKVNPTHRRKSRILDL